jgi:ABC-type transporter Mla subunit MlaD
MARPFQKQRANEVVGVFVLLTVAILVIAVALGPNTRRWLTPTHKLTVRLPPEGSLGLRKGADVLILGSVVGSVDDITLSDAGEMEALVSIRGDFNRFVRRDSQAFIRKPLGIGDAMIEITRGKGDPLPDNAQTIQSVSDKAPTQMLEETLADFRTQIVPALSELRAAVSEYTRLAADLRGQQPGIKAAVGNFNRITEDVEAGKGVVGMLLADPNAADSVRQTIPKLADSMENVRSTTADLRKLVSALPQLKQSAQQTLDEAPGLVLEIEETSRQLQLLVKALQRNWLIRGGIEPSPEDTKISAERVGTDR